MKKFIFYFFVSIISILSIVLVTNIMRNNIQEEISKLKEEQSKDLVLKSFKTQAKNTNFNYLDIQRPDFVEIAKKIAKTTFDVGYSNDSGVRELVDNAGGLMGEIELDAERQMMNRFLQELVKPAPKATYGELMIKQALDQGAVDTLLISEGLRKNSIKLQCKKCSHQWNITLSRSEEIPECPSCDTSSDDIKELESISLIDQLAILASKGNSSITFISVDTEEGSQLLQGFGGLAAILRYPMM